MLKNCFNYVGSKDRIFATIDANLDKGKSYFMDVFCGSGVVGINELGSYKRVYLNDSCWQLALTLKHLRDTEWDILIGEIDKVIGEYELSKENKVGFLKLRDYYNTECSLKEKFNPVIFYTLVTHSFNYLIGFNKGGGYNVPFGANRSYFSGALRTKLKNFQEKIHAEKDRVFINFLGFDKFVDLSSQVIPETMFYCDPPYLASDSSYNRIGYMPKWDGTQENLLYKKLDYINDKGGSFLLSNVVENNGIVNEVLLEWSKKYNMIEVSSDFKNCNYQRKNKGATKEVVVRNY